MNTFDACRLYREANDLLELHYDEGCSTPAELQTEFRNWYDEDKGAAWRRLKAVAKEDPHFFDELVGSTELNAEMDWWRKGIIFSSPRHAPPCRMGASLCWRPCHRLCQCKKQRQSPKKNLCQ